MKKRTGKRQSKGRPVLLSGARRPVDTVDLRRQIEDLIASRAVSMVEATIEAAEGGQYAAMRCLFDLAGLFSAAEPGEGRDSGTLAKTLLDRLEALDEDPSEIEVTKDSGLGTGLAPEHTVK